MGLRAVRHGAAATFAGDAPTKASPKIRSGVKELGAAAVRGLQGDDLADPSAVLACAKHYVGDGGTAFGSSTIGVPTC
jgi:hypothetical protein